MRSRSSSSTSYYSCLSEPELLVHADSKFTDKFGFQSQENFDISTVSKIDQLENELESLKMAKEALQEQLNISKKHQILHEEQMSSKSTIIQKMMLELQNSKASQNDKTDSESYYKDELNAKTRELELTNRMLIEFTKNFKTVEARAYLAEKANQDLKDQSIKNEKIIRKQSKLIEHQEAHFKHFELQMKMKQFLVYKKK